LAEASMWMLRRGNRFISTTLWRLKLYFF